MKIRPHTLVVHGEKLIGYSARLPNRLHLFSKSCDCYKEVILEEVLDGKPETRTLSLQRIGEGLWFTSGVNSLYILDDDGKIHWKLQHDLLRGRPKGFHAAVIYSY